MLIFIFQIVNYWLLILNYGGLVLCFIRRDQFLFVQDILVYYIICSLRHDLIVFCWKETKLKILFFFCGKKLRYVLSYFSLILDDFHCYHWSILHMCTVKGTVNDMLLLLLSHFSCVRLCWPHRRQPTGLPHPWDYPGKNAGVPFPSPMHESEKWKWSRSVVSNS